MVVGESIGYGGYEGYEGYGGYGARVGYVPVEEVYDFIASL